MCFAGAADLHFMWTYTNVTLAIDIQSLCSRFIILTQPSNCQCVKFPAAIRENLSLSPHGFC